MQAGLRAAKQRGVSDQAGLFSGHAGVCVRDISSACVCVPKIIFVDAKVCEEGWFCVLGKKKDKEGRRVRQIPADVRAARTGRDGA